MRKCIEMFKPRGWHSVYSTLVTLIILRSGQFQLCSEGVIEGGYGITDEIIQPPHLWTRDLYDSLQHFFWLFPPSQGKRVIFCPWFRGAQILMALARMLWSWAPSPICPQGQSLGALEIRSALAWALWRLAPEGTVGQQPEDSCFSSSHLKNHFCTYAEIRDTHKNVPCSQQAKEVCVSVCVCVCVI